MAWNVKDLAVAANRVTVNELNAYQVRALSSSFHALLNVDSSVVIIIIIIVTPHIRCNGAAAQEAVEKIKRQPYRSPIQQITRPSTLMHNIFALKIIPLRHFQAWHRQLRTNRSHLPTHLLFCYFILLLMHRRAWCGRCRLHSYVRRKYTNKHNCPMGNGQCKFGMQ